MDDALLPQELPRNPRAGEVLTKLEDIFETLVDPSADRLTLHIRGRELLFPGGNAKESWRFAVLLKIMELTHEALVTGVITTKRNIYYRAPQLFLRQTVVDRYIDDLAHTLEVPRAALNIVATAKGLLFGPLTVKKHDGQVTDCAADAEGMLMPQPNTVASVQFRSTPYVLIIEKEAVFRSLIDAVAHADYPPVLITAKGYPDVATRIFCSLLSASASCPPVYMLVDYDPHGYSILSTYIHGSASLNDQDNQMIMSTAQLLGLRFDDIFGRNDDEILPLTPRDRQLARSMLQKNPAFSETNPDWQRQLQCMLLLNVKAEIQILGTGGELADFVSHRVASAVSKP